MKPSTAAATCRVFLPALALIAGCSPFVQIRGVFIEGWMLCALIGLLGAYIVVLLLARREDDSDLPQSGLFFVGVASCIGLLTWWVFQSGVL